MEDSAHIGGGSGTVLPWLKALGAIMTAAATLLGTLAAIGVFDDDEQPESGAGSTTTSILVDPPAPPTTPPTTPPVDDDPTTTQATTAPDQRAAITIAYTGDIDNCLVSVDIAIGDRTFFPTGTQFPVADVATGVQFYDISGIVTCPTLGQCEAAGSGTIDVAAGRTYFLQWQNVDLGLCAVALV